MWTSPSFTLFSTCLLFSPTAQKDYIQDIKEKYCYVTLEFDKAKEQAHITPRTQNCQLPDGQEIILGPEKFLCPEILFQPDLFGEPLEQQSIREFPWELLIHKPLESWHTFLKHMDTHI